MNFPLGCACGQVTGQMCMSLSPRRLLRWYAGCCRTPVGNTPRNPKLSYAGLAHDCPSGPAFDKDAAFGPPRLAALKTAHNVGGARLSGRYKDNPFFQPGTAEPIVPAQVLSAEHSAALHSGP